MFVRTSFDVNAIFQADICRKQNFFATIDGSDVTCGGPTTLFDPENVVFGPDGNLYIADTYNDRILVYTIST